MVSMVLQWELRTFIFIFLTSGVFCASSSGSDEVLESQRQEVAEHSHKVDSLSLLIFMLLLVLTLVSIWFLKHIALEYRYVHETGLSLLYGVIVGAIVRYCSKPSDLERLTLSAGNSTKVPPDVIRLRFEDLSNWTYRFDSEVSDITDTLREKVTFDPEIFFNVFLPPIIFHAGFSMKKMHFFNNFGSILVYAFIGTTMSSFVVGSITYGVSKIQSSVNFNFAECLFFGSIISATDPVTVLALFSDLGVDPNLYALVFGESALNDAVAIVLSESVNDQVNSARAFSALDALNCLGSFITIFLGSWALGTLVGCLTALLTKFARTLHQHPLIESSLFLLLSYCSYLAAESIGFTGIVSLLFCGVTQAHYTYYNLSLESRRQTKHLFEFMSFLAENFIFLYMGITVFSFPNHSWNWVFVIGAVIGCLLGRAVNIYPLTFLINLVRRHPHKISYNFQHVLMFSGLRGAIAFALAIRNTSTLARQTMLTSTLFIVFVTVGVCGSLANTVLKLLNIRTGLKDEESTEGGDSNRGSGSDVSSGAYDHTQFSNNNANSFDMDVKTNPKFNASENGSPGGMSGSNPPDSTTVHPRVQTHKRETMHPVSLRWYDFDKKYIKPFLTVNQGQPLYLTFPQPWCQPIVKLFSKSREREMFYEHDPMSRDNTHNGANGSRSNNGHSFGNDGGDDGVSNGHAGLKNRGFKPTAAKDIDGESDTDIILDNVGEIAILTPSSSRPDLHSVQQSSFSHENQDPMVKIAAPPTSTTSPKRGRVTPPLDPSRGLGDLANDDDDPNIEVTLQI